MKFRGGKLSQFLEPAGTFVIFSQTNQPILVLWPNGQSPGQPVQDVTGKS